MASRSAIFWARGHGEQSIAFDPETGRPTGYFFDGAYHASLRNRRVVVAGERTLELYDLSSRERIEAFDLAPRGRADDWKHTIRAVALDEDGSGYVYVTADGVVEARRAGEQVWRRELPVEWCLAEGDLVLAFSSPGVEEAKTFALDRRTGDIRWEAPGYVHALDGDGAFLRERGAGLSLRRRDGEIVWRRQGLTPSAFGPHVLATGDVEPGNREIRLFDRLTGEDRAAPGLLTLGSIALVGDALLHWPEYGVLRACDHDGAERWRVNLGYHVAPGGGPLTMLPGRIVVSSADHLVCIEDTT